MAVTFWKAQNPNNAIVAWKKNFELAILRSLRVNAANKGPPAFTACTNFGPVAFS